MLGALGCTAMSLDSSQFFGGSAEREALPAIVEPRVFLGGEALAQKKVRMRRVHADLVHMYRGYVVVTRQQKQQEQTQLEGFIRPFIESQVVPLLAAEGEAWNNDLRALEANLFFAEAALFLALQEQADLAK